jgi:hypothetical protein
MLGLESLENKNLPRTRTEEATPMVPSATRHIESTKLYGYKGFLGFGELKEKP